MDKAEQIRQGIKNLVRPNISSTIATILGKVESVDEDEMTCVITDDTNEISDVRLRPVINGNESMTLFPKVGGWALIVKIEEEEDWMLVGADEIDKIRIKVGTSEFEIKDGFLVKRGTETLKKIFDDLFDAIEQLTVNTNVGPSYVPINVATFAAIKVRVDQLLK